MKRPYLFLAAGAVLVACAREPVQYKARLTAKCRGCIVSYAGGSATSTKDTLLGTVDESSGDTLAEERAYQVFLKEGDQVFLRACRIDLDTAYGPMELSVGGEVRDLFAVADTSQDCVEINGPTQPR